KEISNNLNTSELIEYFRSKTIDAFSTERIIEFWGHPTVEFIINDNRFLYRVFYSDRKKEKHHLYKEEELKDRTIWITYSVHSTSYKIEVFNDKNNKFGLLDEAKKELGEMYKKRKKIEDEMKIKKMF